MMGRRRLAPLQAGVGCFYCEPALLTLPRNRFAMFDEPVSRVFQTVGCWGVIGFGAFFLVLALIWP